MSFLYFQVVEKNAEEVNTQNELRVNDGLAVASLAPSVSLSLLKRIEEIAEWEFFLEFVWLSNWFVPVLKQALLPTGNWFIFSNKDLETVLESFARSSVCYEMNFEERSSMSTLKKLFSSRNIAVAEVDVGT